MSVEFRPIPHSRRSQRLAARALRAELHAVDGRLFMAALQLLHQPSEQVELAWRRLRHRAVGLRAALAAIELFGLGT